MTTPASGIESLIGNADVFPVLRRWTYFNHAGVSPTPRPVADAMRAVIAQCEASAYLGADWWTPIERGRKTAAEFINADGGEIAFVRNTAEGVSLVAGGLEWKPGDRVVTAAVEYPANVYPWMEIVRRHGVELVMVAEEDDPTQPGARHVPIEKLLAAAGHPKTKLVTLSHVEYASGQRNDLARVGAFCRERDILFHVDAIQSLGGLPVDVRAMSIDFLSTGGQKWLLGPMGAGFVFVRRELLERIHPLIVGAGSVINSNDFGNFDYTLKPDATRYEPGTPNLVGMFGLFASIELFNRAGKQAIATQIYAITERLVAGLGERGYRVVSPRGGERWSGIVSFTSPTRDHAAIVKQLREQYQIEILVREGRLRASPHFYNSAEQIDRLLAALPEH